MSVVDLTSEQYDKLSSNLRVATFGKQGDDEVDVVNVFNDLTSEFCLNGNFVRISKSRFSYCGWCVKSSSINNAEQIIWQS